MSRVLVIGDIHAPATHKDYFSFIKRIQKKHNTDRTVFIGDIVDNEAISFHEKSPELPGAMDEYKTAMKIVKKWHKAFPNAKVCIGNHDERISRRAKSQGIPSIYLKNYNEIYDSDGWAWAYRHEIDNVIYTHGIGWGGKTPSFNAACHCQQSVVSGHVHSIAAINWISNGVNPIFGMNVGAGVDYSHPAMNYGKFTLKKPVFGCGVVINGHPYLEIRKD